MKKLKIILSICFLPLLSLAQDTIYINQNKTTTLLFPSEIESPVTTGNEIHGEIKQGNLLLLKAVDKEFQFSSLKISTKDGEVYNLAIAFSYGRGGHLHKVKLPISSELVKVSETDPLVNISEKIDREKKFKSISSAKNGKIDADLGDITTADNVIFFRLKVANGSNINYDVDFIRFYVRDLKTAKRTVTQEQEIYPISSYGFETKTVMGRKSQQYVFGLKKFALAKDKALFVEVYEKNGGRQLYLKVEQADIEDARAIK